MPITPTYPGVYIEELPSGVRTITGTATSIAAFVGRAKRGPADTATMINSYGDFERIFGGLWIDSTLGYAVRDFFLNGGSQAIVVRLFNPDQSNDQATIELTRRLTLEAASPGRWGNHLRARVDYDVTDSVAFALSVTRNDLFNLTIRDTATGATEQFRNVTMKTGARQVSNILKNESNLVRALKASPTTRPAAHANPKPGHDIFEPRPGNEKFDDSTTSTGVAADKEASDGIALTQENFAGSGKEAAKEGLYALEQADLFNLLCIPPYLATNDIDAALVDIAADYCTRRRAFYLIDPPAKWKTKEQAKAGVDNDIGAGSANAAVYFPRLRQPNPLRGNQLEEFAPCGAVAGILARTDAQRGVWKAPAGLEATLNGVPQLSVTLNDLENGELNMKGVNCLRVLPAAGRVVWGTRTRLGDDRLASEWKYVPVRRLALHIEESLYRGTQWVVFEPNDEPLWGQIRLNLGSFMHDLFRKGAFQGASPKEAYFVKCDHETTTQSDINQGIVNIVVGFAPLKPAEFVIISLQQMAGQL